MYILYVLKCCDGSLYTGITNDLDKRLQAHEGGKGSKYVRAHLPFRLIYSEEHADKSSAQKREWEIKSWSRDRKIRELELTW